MFIYTDLMYKGYVLLTILCLFKIITTKLSVFMVFIN